MYLRTLERVTTVAYQTMENIIASRMDGWIPTFKQHCHHCVDKAAAPLGNEVFFFCSAFLRDFSLWLDQLSSDASDTWRSPAM